MNQEKRIKILEQFKKNDPNPKTELNWSTPFELLIAVLLSAQAKDTSVNKATKKLYQVANTPQTLFSLQEDKIKKYIKTIGLFNSKAQNVIKTCRILIEEHKGEVPENREALEALPGVGRKTANVILNTVFGWPTIAVDTHVYRTANRTKFAIGKTANDVERKLLKVVPKAFKRNTHHWLVFHGRYTCTSRKPRCKNCTIEELCEFKAKTK
ncbi:endonuclease III [Candidatus Photodesmus blepharus]|uniref:Endonuclease III n=1 Tax=Candidatus Photodesmus blepharonis TaxID=1179155 RepID=A0A084CN14_9GAMM|nr:endonuclease III [Candidatus Photodesmus blepharus]KEY91193.1 endonuclease III [Candidatus Photodesmus blepharus]